MSARAARIAVANMVPVAAFMSARLPNWPRGIGLGRPIAGRMENSAPPINPLPRADHRNGGGET
jgi:hypothetical protein